MAIKVNHD